MKKVLISQRRDHIENRDEIRDSIDVRWAKFLFNLGFLPIPVCSELAGKKDYLKKLSPDCILLSGGNTIKESHQRDLIEKELLDYAAINNLSVLGVCRGMQMLNYYLDGELINIHGHVGKNHKLIGSWAEDKGYKKVNSFHNQAINKETISESIEILATSQDGVIEAIRHKYLPWLGIMWHPERGEFNKIDQNLILQLFEHKKI